MKYHIHAQLNNLLKSSHSRVSEWFDNEYQKVNPLFYTSVDIRDSGYKIVPVDTNIFPAGFNNINKSKYNVASNKIDSFLSSFDKNNNILIIPEKITRNEYYFENIKILKSLISISGRNVEVEELGDKLCVNSRRELHTQEGFMPDIIILNNDLTTKVPEILCDIKQPIIPNTKSGWHTRNKSDHFQTYSDVITRFCKEFAIDPFLLSSMFSNCSKVNFKDSTGIDCIANDVEKMLHLLKEKYKQYKIDTSPYVFIKAETGTFGMGIMIAKSGEEIYNMNRQLRKKMHVIKEGKVNSKVLIQEGIPTDIEYNGHPAEILSYLISGEVVDSFLRLNKTRNAFTSLNKAGAEFLEVNSSHKSYEYLHIYNVMAKLSALAAALE